MDKTYEDFLKEFLSAKEFNKLSKLNNPEILSFVGEYIKLCEPKSVFVCTDSCQDKEYIRRQAVSINEEKELCVKGHTVHFDGYNDQGRDKSATRYLVTGGQKINRYANSLEREAGLKEIRGLLRASMKQKEMLVCFFSLGPINSDFSIGAIQITDSFYVAHSEDILYRPGYEEIKNNSRKGFFKFVHSAGKLEGNVSKDIEKRRVYIDLSQDIVYSVNTQYAGNTVGLKKLALRLAIQKAGKEGWLAEHMFLMGINDDKGKKEYFCGAYPSMCGKTSTAMLSGESIVGDDIAYIRKNNGKAYAVNVERGIFGIIKDVNEKNDAVLFNALNSPGEIIFSNILVDKDNHPFWIGKNDDLPHKGINFSGHWFPGKTDNQGQEIPPSHKNARYTIGLKGLENVDDSLDDPGGLNVRGFIYGGRDSDTSVPVEEALSWNHGIILKAASLESETTAATLGQEGVRVFNPMSNVDFLSIPLGKYIEMNLNFSSGLPNPPLIFSVNYFLRDSQGKFLNDIQDKRVWLKWIRLRIDRSLKAITTPTGLIPFYGDLKSLFSRVLSKDYSFRDYKRQFSLRVPENLAKIERITNIYRELEGIPETLLREISAQRQRLEECRKAGGDYIEPSFFSGEK
ncbi:MAG: phosphoenolpyruvate carboxykinase (GTP) [Candidatus Omnitrophica bacterium]|nr:phosphoenolpyruvate carboxykinase (GTP) [Candidatus Omnitrophota bacterium]MDD5429363.1 phosphoenolpyruvate carboxykinase (GTP) [Candidatus Omnitrophota bacterium]